MPLDSDVALLGTGVAPLVAASHLLAEGKSVLVLNPDRDFFLEDSEFSLDPLLFSTGIDRKRVSMSIPENVLGLLRPEFPGAIEFWAPGQDRSGYHDELAPHVRQRDRLWIARDGEQELIEDLYIDFSDSDLNPRILDGPQACARFPAGSPKTDLKALLVPRLCDVDVPRYRNGLLEFLLERLGRERLACLTTQIELMPGGIRFHVRKTPMTARLNHGMIVFWTPKLTAWVLAQAKKSEAKLVKPTGVRLWEQWSVISREALNAGTVGTFRDIVVWAEIEGIPPKDAGQTGLTRLSVLRAGDLVAIDGMVNPKQPFGWASPGSFKDIGDLCQGFLRWEKATVRMMRPRAVLEWDVKQTSVLSEHGPRVEIAPASDGPLSEVVRNARSMAAQIIKGT